MTNTQNTQPATLTLVQVKRIGSDDNFRAARAASVVAFAGDDFDWTVRGAVPAAILAAMGLTEHPEPQKTGAKGAQKETTYGVGFRVLADAVRALVKSSKPTLPVLRVTLSGEGGGSTTVAPDHALYASLVALISADAEV